MKKIIFLFILLVLTTFGYMLFESSFPFLRASEQDIYSNWQTFYYDEISLKYPSGWKIFDGDIDCAHVTEFDSLRLIAFSTCYSDSLSSPMLSFDETFRRFKNSFIKNGVSEEKNINNIDMVVIKYKNGFSIENGIFVLSSAEGTIAIWQGDNSSYALFDEKSQHQSDGIFEEILYSLKLQ